MAEYGELAAAFGQLGYKLAALSVDSPQRSAALQKRLALPFPLLSDPERVQVKAWGIYNPRERGGIALPTTAVLDPGGRIAWIETGGTATRSRAAALLEFLRGNTGPPAARRYFPRWRDWRRLLRF